MSLFTLMALLLASPPAVTPHMNGVALSLYYEDPAQDMYFIRMVDEIAETGATHISIIVQWAQYDTSSSTIAPHPKETTADPVVAKVIRRAQMHGLSVMLFPILWVERRGPGDWRGTLKPGVPETWWRSYGRFISHYASLAEQLGVEVLSVGSEFASLEKERARWAALIKEVRQRFAGRLIYSANWDHYREVSFWDLVDYAGITGYYRLTEKMDPTQEELSAAWGLIKERLLDWQKSMGRPLVFTELGYPSLDGAARSPWDYTTGTELDLAEQAMCFNAFFDTWRGEERLAGAYFWNWWGPGKGTDTWYTIKGKPAESLLRRWFARKQSKLPKKE